MGEIKSTGDLLVWFFNGEPHFAALAIFNIAILAGMHFRNQKKFDKLYELVRTVQIGQAASDKRIDIHADHFNVIDKNMDRCLDISVKSHDISTDATKMILSLLRKRK